MTIDLSFCDIHGKELNEQETANCYVISEPGNYCFPLVYGNAVKGGKDNPDSYTNLNPTIKDNKNYLSYNFVDHRENPIVKPEIWCEVKKADLIISDDSYNIIQNIKVSSGYVEFTITNIPENGANYIIGAYNKSNHIVWSWHLWLWKDELKDIEIGNYKILNIDLASKIVGGENKSWFYQWGRKDPQPFFDVCEKLLKESNNRLVQKGIRHPNCFYMSSDESWCKIKNNSYYNYWNSDILSEKTIKTIYDPCPRGYKVVEHRFFEELCADPKNILLKPHCALFDIYGQKIILLYHGAKENCSEVIDNQGFYWSAGGMQNFMNICGEYMGYPNLTIYSGGYNLAFGYQSGNGGSIRPQKEED